MSNADKPIVIDGEYEMFINDTDIPFVIEGMLTNGKESLMIKYVDGKHLVKKYELDGNTDYVIKEFAAHRMDCNGIAALIFRQYWHEEEDELCLRMKVLTPKELVFVGFKKEN